ncbi:MAG: hypothetical protein O2887_01110 [Bacteroidetes bacterium]|nr:hypothetical protein [Bacteroidota bacterium]MDA1119088.1 hypothetical protein [Bacteroidota bacterium]
MESIAKCYLGKLNDDSNMCVLHQDRLVIIKNGRVTIFPLEEGLSFQVDHKKWMLPLISGGILGSLTLVAIFKSLYHPWYSLFSLLIASFLLFIGIDGSHVLIVKVDKVATNFPIASDSQDIRKFIAQVKELIATT